MLRPKYRQERVSKYPREIIRWMVDSLNSRLERYHCRLVFAEDTKKLYFYRYIPEYDDWAEEGVFGGGLWCLLHVLNAISMMMFLCREGVFQSESKGGDNDGLRKGS